jgi:nitrate reductase beta subunit
MSGGKARPGRVMAQVAMVMNLDKCIGCHTCSVTCKQTWTNRSGTEYVWFNNVETRPGQGYPRGYENQDRWKGGWQLRHGRLVPRTGGRARRLATLFANPELPSLDDYYQPWTYDYENLTTAPLGDDVPTARPRSLVDGGATAVTWGPNWDDDLGGGPEHIAGDPVLSRMNEQVRLEYERAFMFYLPRICEHCLNPSCVAVCPSGALYKRVEDGIVLVDQDRCRGWRMCVSGCPYKKVYFNHQTGKAEKVPSATRASRPVNPPCAPRPAWGGCATSASCSTTRTGSARPRPCRTRRTCTRPSWGASSIPTTPKWPARPRSQAFRMTGSPRRAVHRSTP